MQDYLSESKWSAGIWQEGSRPLRDESVRIRTLLYDVASTSLREHDKVYWDEVVAVQLSAGGGSALARSSNGRSSTRIA
jgi:hypothetical protein